MHALRIIWKRTRSTAAEAPGAAAAASCAGIRYATASAMIGGVVVGTAVVAGAAAVSIAVGIVLTVVVDCRIITPQQHAAAARSSR